MDSERPTPLPRVRHGRVSKMEVQHDSLQCVRSPQGQAGEAVFASHRTALYLSPCAPALRPLRLALTRCLCSTLPTGPRRSRRPVRKSRGSLTIVEKCARCTGAPCRHAALPAGRPRQLDFSHGPHAACNSPLLNRYPHPARRHATRLHAIGELYGLWPVRHTIPHGAAQWRARAACSHAATALGQHGRWSGDDAFARP